MEVKSLALASLLLVIPIYISNREKLGLGKDIIISITRAIIQLVAVGYILKYIFVANNKIITVTLVLIMIINAAINTRKRGKGIKNVFFISFGTLLVSTSVTLTVLVLSKAIKFNPDEIIPVSGMIISQAMVAVGLAYRTLVSSFRERRTEIEAKLSLGAGRKEASKEIIRKAIKFAMSPNIDSAKTLGIVSLPGMMTGLILGGASPMEAIKFQIMVTFMMVSASSISIMIATYMGYKSFFNERKQLVIN
ncbi:MAG: ABC transporter permease [Sarcina sp.]